MRNRSRHLALAIGMALAWIPAAAHTLPDPRVLVLVPSPEALEVRLNDLLQPGAESIELKRRFDQDRDGKIAEWEKKDLGEFLVARAKMNLRVVQDREPLALETVSWRVTGADGSVDSSGMVSLDLVLRAKPRTAAGRVALTVSDWRPDGHPVRAAVLAQSARVLSAKPGRLDESGRVVTGIDLSRDHPLELTYSPLP